MRPAKSAKELRDLTDEELAEYWSGWKSNTSDYFLVEMEVRRRQSVPSELRGWIALIVSVAALVVSGVALVAKH